MALALPKARCAREPAEVRLAPSQIKNLPRESILSFSWGKPWCWHSGAWLVSAAPWACSAATLVRRVQGGCLCCHSAQHAFSQLAEEKMCCKAEMKASNLKSSRQMRMLGGETQNVLWGVPTALVLQVHLSRHRTGSVCHLRGQKKPKREQVWVSELGRRKIFNLEQSKTLHSTWTLLFP